MASVAGSKLHHCGPVTRAEAQLYKIELYPYGFRVTFVGFVQKEEMAAWVLESRTALAKAPKAFGVLVDMRSLKLLSDRSNALMQEGQRHYKAAGMQRSAVILESMLVTLQFKNIAKKTGIYQWERYISATTNPDWEKMALDWIVNGVDPDKG